MEDLFEYSSFLIGLGVSVFAGVMLATGSLSSLGLFAFVPMFLGATGYMYHSMNKLLPIDYASVIEVSEIRSAA
jgi:hypothetical protein